MPLRFVEEPPDSALELDEIQGDVLVGLQKNAEAFWLIDIVAVAAFKSALRASLDKIVFSDEAVVRERLLLALKQNGGEKPNFVAANILFSRAGLGKLTDIADADFGEAFGRSVAEREAVLLDPPDKRLASFDEDADAVLLVTAADEVTLANEVSGWRAAFGGAVRQRHFEIGRVRPDGEKGHEHFGFLDGVSQPGVEGLTVPGQHAPGTPAGDPEQGLPGQDLIKPGSFVLGYQKQRGGDAKPPLPWMRNGSYMVLRRLEQQVARFHSFLVAAAASKDISEGLLGAQLVGRWKSGAPVIVASTADDQALAEDKFRNNDFDFNQDNRQQKCPFLSHIRKSYPRDDLDFTPRFPEKGDGEAFAEQHRILRAGIPFGHEVGEDSDHGPAEHVGHEASRGLMFVSYQSSIDDGFEFIQTQWCNKPDFVSDKPPGGASITPGHDLIIGQTANGERFGDLSTPSVSDVMRNVPPFVIPTGTTYFFAPSRAALRHVLTV